jgi:hypothetical protein
VGWDFVVDIDCDDFLHGRATAVVFCKALEEHGIKGYSVKFTGGSGFHIGIPWASMPKRVDYKPTETLFPELPRAMAAYMKEYCRDQLEEALLKVAPPEKLAEQAKIDAGTLLTKDGIDPYKLVEIDAVLLSPRHLFRMPYSLNAKSFLASLPVKPADLPTFSREMANPSRFKATLGFLDSGIENEAGALVAETMDWQAKNKRSFGAKAPAREYKFSRAVEPEHFPPCIKRISEGLADGKKRALFVLLNFLSSAGWKWDDIEKFVEGWNQKNSPPLPDNYIRTHIKWNSSRMQSQGRSMLPPGCTNEGWYTAIGVCFPDEICGGAVKSVKNPANYPVRKLGMLKSEPKQERQQPRRQARRPRDPWPRAAPRPKDKSLSPNK